MLAAVKTIVMKIFCPKVTGMFIIGNKVTWIARDTPKPIAVLVIDSKSDSFLLCMVLPITEYSTFTCIIDYWINLFGCK